MKLASHDIVRERLESTGADVDYLQVSADGKVLIYRASYAPHESAIRSIPALFVTLCISGGGQVRQEAGLQELDCEVQTGDIGVVPPRSSGAGRWPEMSVITIGISVDCVADSFGNDWPKKLKKSVVSKLFRDPLVEATMMDIGYTRAGKVSDATLLHASHMIIHQLLDSPFGGPKISDDEHPLGPTVMTRVQDLLAANMDRHIAVEEMAEIAGISKHHFSRRFKATTGQAPLQYAIQRKLDHAAALLAEDESFSIISIAQRVGYSNPAQFARLFRRHFGLAPRHWRKNRTM